MADQDPALTPNTMTVLEFEGEALSALNEEFLEFRHNFSIMLEVEPDGTYCLKLKADNGRWTLPLPEGVSARVERLYS